MNQQTYTHEQYIQAVREIAGQRLNDIERTAILDAKLVYGAGSKMVRGVTYYDCWKNGHDHAFAEICAFGEESPIQVAGTTLHELGHILSRGHGHGKGWIKACNRLGLRFVRAGGTRYNLACFAPDIRKAIAALPAPTDGRPVPTGGFNPNGQPIQIKIRPCSAGVGVKGGKSRGQGSGSRMRKFVCSCGVIVRAGRDELNATCNDCGTAFKRADSDAKDHKCQHLH